MHGAEVDVVVCARFWTSSAAPLCARARRDWSGALQARRVTTDGRWVPDNAALSQHRPAPKACRVARRDQRQAESAANFLSNGIGGRLPDRIHPSGRRPLVLLLVLDSCKGEFPPLLLKPSHGTDRAVNQQTRSSTRSPRDRNSSTCPVPPARMRSGRTLPSRRHSSRGPIRTGERSPCRVLNPRIKNRITSPPT